MRVRYDAHKHRQLDRLLAAPCHPGDRRVPVVIALGRGGFQRSPLREGRNRGTAMSGDALRDSRVLVCHIAMLIAVSQSTFRDFLAQRDKDRSPT